MTHSVNLKSQRFRHKQKFKEFIFIGNMTEKSVANATKKLNLAPDSQLVSQASVEDSLLIVRLYTPKNISHQLKDLKVKPGAVIKLVSKTNNGSVVVSLDNQLIGIGAEIASQIVATLAT